MSEPGTNAIVGSAQDQVRRDTPAAFGVSTPDSLEALAQTEFPQLCGLARRFGLQGHEAEDAAQEAIAKAWVKRSSFRGQSSYKTWLTQIAVNEYRNRLRRQRIWNRIADVLVRTPAPDARNPRITAESREAHDLAMECVARLSDKLRDVFVLRFLEELEYPEIADILGTTENAVRTRACEARKRLRSMLKEHGL